MVTKWTKAKLRDARIVNAHELATRGGGLTLVVSYQKRELGRVSRSAAWKVWRTRHQVDPHSHYSDHGAKSFIVWRREDKEAVRLEALAWASNKYGIKEWERSPFGSYHPKGTLAAATTEGN